MKRLLYIPLTLALLLVMASCEKDLPLFSETKGRLNFVYQYNYLSDSIYRFSFVYGPAETVVDTVWLEVSTMGMPADRDRTFALQQLTTGENDAVEGVHYVPFDDPELVSRFYYIPAGAIETKIPIVVKRDASLKTANYTLRVGFLPNEEFDYGSKEFSFKHIVISDQLVQPRNWHTYACDYFLGEYGPVKHQFMIDVSGEKWDDEYVDTVIRSYYYGDQNYLFYLAQLFHRAKEKYNATHDEPLCEEGGIPVEFSFGAGFE